MNTTVERMYKEYGVEYEDRYFNCEIITCPYSIPCEACDKAKEVFCYPSFTCEKQIELIKLLAELNINICKVKNDDDIEFCISIVNSEIEYSNKDFSELLATVVIEHKFELDNAKVKEILER